MTPPTASGIVKGRPGLENSLEAEASGHIGPCDDLIECITVPMLEDLDMENTTDLTTNGAIGRGRRCATH